MTKGERQIRRDELGYWISRRIEEAREAKVLYRREAKALWEALREILSKEYDHWRDDDSPKGKTVPGVRYRRQGVSGGDHGDDLPGPPHSSTSSGNRSADTERACPGGYSTHAHIARKHSTTPTHVF